MGFFIALVLAWYHGEKGRQRVSGPELMMIAALLIVAGVALSTLGEGDGPAEPTPEVVNEDQRPRIAVLPLHNLSPDPDDAFFAGGVQEDLTAKLSRISSVAVISRSSVEQYKDDRPPLRQIASELGTDYLLEGSARIAGDSVRITVQLIQGETDLHLWTEDFDAAYSPDAYFGLQAEIVQRIAFQLRTAIFPDDLQWLEAVPTQSLEALEAYMRGNEEYLYESLRGLTSEWTELASIRWYELAIEIDPDFALALARLAVAGTWTFCCTEGASERVERLGNRALALTPDLPEARVALARVLWGSGEREEALAQLQAAQLIAPEHPEVALYLAQYQSALGEHDLAIRAYERLERSLPRDPLMPRQLMFLYILTHQYDKALDAADRLAARSSPAPNSMYRSRAFIHLARGDGQKAEAAMSAILRDTPGAFYTNNHDAHMRVLERLLDPEERRLSFEAARTTASTFFDDEGRPRLFFFINAAIHEAALGRTEDSRIHWDSVRTKLERAPPASDALPARLRSYLNDLTLAYVGLEEREKALQTAVQLVEPPFEPGCREGDSRRCRVLARVYAHFGEHDEAINLLEQMLPAPSYLTVHILEVDPIWDPLRDHPRFQALLEQYGSEP
jgi:TolB-like protein